MYTLGIGVAKPRHHAILPDEVRTPVFRNFAVPHSHQGSKILKFRCPVLVRSRAHAGWFIVLRISPSADPWTR